MKFREDKSRPPAAVGPLCDTSGDKRMRDGEPSVIQLRRFKNDRSQRAQEWIVCCGCGYRHLYTYEVFRPKGGKDGDPMYMVTRAYGDPLTKPRS